MSDLAEFLDEFAPGFSRKPVAPRCEHRGGFGGKGRCPCNATVRIGGRGYCIHHARREGNAVPQAD